MKKILLVTTSDKMAGAEKSIFQLLNFIDKSKYEFRLVILRNEKGGELLRRCSDLDVKVESLNISSKWQFYKIIKLWQIIKSFNPDILQSFLFFDNQICRILGKIAGVKYIISGQRNVENKISPIRIFIDKLTINFATAIISNTKAGKDFYKNFNYSFNKEIYVARNGLDIENLKKLQNDLNNDFFTESQFPDNIPKIFTTGFLTEQKGITYLIKAIEILEKKGIRVECFIIGQGPLEQSLINESKEMKVDDRIHFLGYVSEAYKYFKFFDIFVLSSLWEGLPNVILEAVANKLIVVATSVGGVSEIIKNEETGFLVEPGSAQLLADKIEYVISLNESKKEKITESALELLKNDFSMSSFIKKYEDFYDKCN